jgi:hypothetical protein
VGKTSPTSPVAPNPFEIAATVAFPAVPLDIEDALDADGAPSRQDLLHRAAVLGPSRMTWENIELKSTDPILGEKMQPRVVERRARLRRVVKVALAAGVALCLVATGASALSPSKPAAAVKTSPAVGVVLVEKMDLAVRGKAPGHVTATAHPVASVPRSKRK